MQIIEPLILSQNRINLDSGESSVRWYGWSTAAGVTWSDQSLSRVVSRGPDYACDVALPAVVFGTPEEIRSDIARELRCHSAALNLD